MLNITYEIVHGFKNHNCSLSVLSNYCDIIYKYGDITDIDLLLKAFVQSPTDYERIQLLGPIMRHGNLNHAEYLYRSLVRNKKIGEDYPSELLHGLGYMGYEPVKSELIKHMGSKDYYESQYACLGLLHFDCTEFISLIREEIEMCFGKSLFNEFIPVLSIKAKDTHLKGKIYELGITTASTDCNAGIILGLALYEDKELFKKIIWNERWEAHYGGTGTNYWAYISIRHLGISLSELFLEIKCAISSGLDRRESEYRIEMLMELLREKIFINQMPLKFIKEDKESFEAVYNTLFEWSNPDKDDSITGIAYYYLTNEELYSRLIDIKRLLELRINQELIEKVFS